MDKKYLSYIVVLKDLKDLNCQSIQITLDGIKETHDERRIFKNGDGTFDKIINKIKMVRDDDEMPNPIIRINIDKDNSKDVEKLADGRVYTAKQAQKNGLIDYIGTWDDSVSQIKQSKKFSTDFQIVDFSYQQKQTFYNYLMGAANSFKKTASSNKVIPQAVLDAITPQTPFPAYYYDSER